MNINLGQIVGVKWNERKKSVTKTQALCQAPQTRKSEKDASKQGNPRIDSGNIEGSCFTS